jgi:hypothetical protein
VQRRLLSLTVALCAIATGGCGAAAQDNAASGATPSVAPTRSAATPRAEPSPRPDAAAVVATALARRMPAETGVAIATLDGGPVVSVGPEAPTAAWSTMKLPVIVTVLQARRAGALPGETEPTAVERDAIGRAISASDNAAAQSLYGELTARYGDDHAATRRIDETLRLAGDARTHVNFRVSRPGFSSFGQTRWKLPDIARFYRALAAGRLLGAADDELVLGAMADVDANQRWGAHAVSWPRGGAALVKGGWGPTPAGAYDVLQVAIVRGETKLILAFATVAPTFAAGQERLTGLAAAAAHALRGR